MMKEKYSLYISFVFAGFLLVHQPIFAQSINAHHVYWMDKDQMYDYDPLTATYIVLDIKMPQNCSGLAIAHHPNLNDSLTFFTTVSGYLYYYKGNKWINSNDSIPSVNLAGGKKFIFVLDGINSRIYRYDFSGVSKLILDMPVTFAGPYDLVCDEGDNFYLMHTKLKLLRKYDQDGNLISEIKLEGLQDQASGGGIAIIDNFVFANVTNKSIVGTYTGEKIVFEPTGTMLSSMNDFATVPLKLDFQFKKSDSLLFSELIKTVVYSKMNRPVIIKDTVSNIKGPIEVEVWVSSDDSKCTMKMEHNEESIKKQIVITKKRLKLDLVFPPNTSSHLIVFDLIDTNGSFKVSFNIAIIAEGKEYVYTLKADFKDSCGLVLELD